MGIIQRQTLKSTVYIYAGVIIGFITTALVYPKVLTPSQIGVIGLLGSWSAVFAQFATLGFGGATVKFFPSFRSSDKNHYGFLFILLVITALGFVVFMGLYYLLRPWIIQSTQDSPLFHEQLYLIIPYTLFQLLFLALDTYNRMLYNSTTGMLLRELVLRLLILATISLFFFQLFGFVRFVEWYVGAQGVITLLLIAFLVWRGEFNPKPDFRRLDTPMMKGMASLSVFSFLTGFSSLAIMRIDSIMIGSYLTDYEVGIYITTLNFGTLVQLPSRALRGIAPTLIAESLKRNELAEVENIYRKSTITQLVIGLYLMLGIWVNTNTIFTILPEEYQAGLYVVLFIGLSNVVRMAGGMSDVIVGYSEYYKLNTVFNAGWLLLIVLTNMIFIPLQGISGAALASLISVIAVTAARHFFLQRKFGMQPYNKNHGLAILLALITYGIVYLIPTLSPFWLDLLVRGILVTLIYGLSSYYLRVSPEINQLIETSLIRLRSLF
uniref:Oligosaccharide flippase family protein n=1 Tax=Roseihalotalea indica TaxID=2867963 RepID=A0AA49JG08_9BACT|nr:oligosaccharide flippase family protein [Tunicatimonas sp. TK19036]